MGWSFIIEWKLFSEIPSNIIPSFIRWLTGWNVWYEKKTYFKVFIQHRIMRYICRIEIKVIWISRQRNFNLEKKLHFPDKIPCAHLFYWRYSEFQKSKYGIRPQALQIRIQIKIYIVFGCLKIINIVYFKLQYHDKFH